MEGMGIDGTVMGLGCSATAGGDTGVESIDGRVLGSDFVSCALISPSLGAGIDSDALESMLVLLVSAVAAVFRTAGLSGREGASEEVFGLSARCFTALASRSCSLEFGLLLCDEVRDTPGFRVSTLTRTAYPSQHMYPPSTWSFFFSASCLAAASAAFFFSASSFCFTA